VQLTLCKSLFVESDPKFIQGKEKNGEKENEKTNRVIGKITIEEEENDKESNENCSTCYVNGFCRLDPSDRLRRYGNNDDDSSTGSNNSRDSSYDEDGGNNSRDEETACSGYFIRIIRDIMEKYHDRSTGYGRQGI